MDRIAVAGARRHAPSELLASSSSQAIGKKTAGRWLAICIATKRLGAQIHGSGTSIYSVAGSGVSDTKIRESDWAFSDHRETVHFFARGCCRAYDINDLDLRLLWGWPQGSVFIDVHNQPPQKCFLGHGVLHIAAHRRHAYVFIEGAHYSAHPSFD